MAQLSDLQAAIDAAFDKAKAGLDNTVTVMEAAIAAIKSGQTPPADNPAVQAMIDDVNARTDALVKEAADETAKLSDVLPHS